MKRLTSAQLFAAPKRAGKAKARLERAKLVIVAARGRAAETAQQCAVQPSTMRPPTVLQRRRLAERLSAKSRRSRKAPRVHHAARRAELELLLLPLIWF